MTHVIANLQNKINANSESGLGLLDNFARNLKVFDWSNSTTWQILNQGFANNDDALDVLRRVQLDTLTGSAEGERLNGSIADERLMGFGGDDILNGAAGNDLLEAGDGNDILEAGAGNDTLSGGSGNDVLDGNAGSDCYIFQHGFGNDHIHQYDTAVDSVDVAIFSDLSPQNIVKTTRQGDDLSLLFSTSDQLTIDGYFDVAARRVDFFQFFNGEKWDLATVKVHVDTLGPLEDDTLYGYTGGDNRLFGLDANDELHGNTGNDFVNGGEGNDTLYGQSGDDTLDGGMGVDILKGGNGNDLYYVNSINDSIVETTNAGLDTVLSSVNYMLPVNIENLTLATSAGNSNATGNVLDNLLVGNEGNNVLSGGRGNDTLQGSQGNDIYLFGKGDGQDSIIDNSNVGEINVLQFKSDVTPTKVTVSHLGNDLILSIIGTTDKITVNSSFNNELNTVCPSVKQVLFSDGTSWNLWMGLGMA